MENNESQTDLSLRKKDSFSNVPVEPIIKNSCLLYFRSMGISMGSLMMGYLFVIISTLSSSIENKLKSNGNDSISFSLYISICTTALPCGALVGSLMYSKILKIIQSENKLMIYCDFAMTALIFLQLLTLNIYLLIFTRLLQGFLIGIAGIIVPTYIMSLSPTSISGRIGSFNQIFITIGIAVGYSMGYIIDVKELDSPLNWRICVAYPIILCFIRIGICFMNQMDTIERHIQNKEWKVLQEYIDKFYEEGTFTLEGLLKSKNFSTSLLEQTNSTTKLNSSEPMREEIKIPSEVIESRDEMIEQTRSSKIRKTLGVVLCIMNQFSGINAILFYSNELFLGLSQGDTEYAVRKSLELGIFQILVTLVSGSFMDNFGRRTLMIFGEILIISSLFSGYYMIDFDSSNQWDPKYVAYAIFAHIGGFSLSLGPVTVVYISEILDDISPYMTFIWVETIFIALTSNIMIEKLGIGKVFLLYALVSLTGLTYVWKFMIESKGQTKNQILKCYETLSENENSFIVQIEVPSLKGTPKNYQKINVDMEDNEHN